jgi:hypothetical protein
MVFFTIIEGSVNINLDKGLLATPSNELIISPTFKYLKLRKNVGLNLN